MPLYEEFDYYTVSDYAQWGGDLDLIRGRPQAMTPLPGISYQRVSGNLLRKFHEQLEDCPRDWERRFAGSSLR